MSRARGASLTGALLVPLLCLTHAAQAVGIFEIPADAPIDVHDGSLADWRAVVPGPTYRLADLTPTACTLSLLNPADSLDMELDVYLAWTAHPPRIYAAFDMRDDYFATTWEASDSNVPFTKQRLEIGVDADRAAPNSFSYFEYDGPGAGWSYRYAQLWRVMFVQGSELADRSDLLLYPLPGDGLTRWLFAPPWSDLGGWIDKALNTALVELLATPFDSVAMQDGPAASDIAELAQGDTIGLQLSVTDYDSEIPDDDFEALQAARKSWWLPDLPTCVELEAGGASPTVPVALLGPWDGTTSVEERSWGQVKRARRDVIPGMP